MYNFGRVSKQLNKSINATVSIFIFVIYFDRFDSLESFSRIKLRVVKNNVLEIDRNKYKNEDINSCVHALIQTDVDT